MDYELDNVFNVIIFILILIVAFSYLSYNNKPIIDTFTNRSSYLPNGKRKFIYNNNINNLDPVIVNFELKQNKYLSVFKHKGIQGYKPMGYCTHVTSQQIKTDNNSLQQIMDNNQSLHLLSGHNIQPTEYIKMWHSGKMCEYRGDIFTIYRPIHTDSKYIALGDIIVKGVQPPSNVMTMIPSDDLSEIDHHNGMLWNFQKRGVCLGEIHEDPEKNPNPNNVICNSVSGHNFFKCNSTMMQDINGNNKHYSVKQNFIPDQSSENLVVSLKVKNV